MRHRLHSICPYFAMFPETFVERQLQRYTAEGDYVFDPFSGRGTTLFEAILSGRNAAALDINPVAFCLTKAKAETPELEHVKRRLTGLCKLLDKEAVELEAERTQLPAFFRRAFYHSTLRELLFLRRRLRWREVAVDNFIAAVVLGALHGEMDRSSSYFSNQMPRTICLKPDYSLRYWSHHRLYPRRRDVFAMLEKKSEFRLQGSKVATRGMAKLADARKAAAAFPELVRRVQLVVTSPPYLAVTRFEEDQWLRLWFLGGPPRPTYGLVSTDDRHYTPTRYWKFLSDVWLGIEPLLRRDAIMVLRIGAKSLTLGDICGGLLGSLRTVFPAGKWLDEPAISQIRGKQVRAFNPRALGCQYEADFAYAPFQV